MTRTQMIVYLADKLGSHQAAGKVYTRRTQRISNASAQERGLDAADLAEFRKRKLMARVGRNPATGEQTKIPARAWLRFTPAKALKHSVLAAR